LKRYGLNARRRGAQPRTIRSARDERQRAERRRDERNCLTSNAHDSISFCHAAEVKSRFVPDLGRGLEETEVSTEEWDDAAATKNEI
jgi:hypothetical protein